MNNKPRIKCVTYGGKIGWFLRKHFSKYTSELYLSYQYQVRKRLFKRYIDYWRDNTDMIIQPCLISIETINRCNSDCEFCPANRNSESRPFAKMTEELFVKIIDDLIELDYAGYLNLYVNNEPFMDKRIEDWYKYAKEHLPKAKMLLYTNGTLMTVDRFKKIAPYVDMMIINNYSDKLEMHKNISDVYSFVKNNNSYWDKDITIQLRYNKEILTNRAGEAPNKNRKSKKDKWLCVMPFTDITIYPNGVFGMCCSDALEKTNLGSLENNSLKDIWMSEKYNELRESMREGRGGCGFCQGCDFVDAGIRNSFIKNMLS